MKFTILLSLFCILNADQINGFKLTNTKMPYSPTDTVDITLFYESLCPASRGYSQIIITYIFFCYSYENFKLGFVSGELWKAFMAVGSIMNITLYPYGNAWQMYVRENNSWLFTCQHGPDECWGNLFHACVISNYPQKENYFPVIYCMMSYNINIQDAARICSNKYNISMSLVQQCMASPQGNAKMHDLAVMTEKSEHGYVPWITINQVHSNEIQNKAGNNLIEYVCQTYRVIYLF